MPMENFHGARVRDPGDFIEDSYVTITLRGTKGVELVSGKLTSDGKKGSLTAQAYRFPKKNYSPKEAKRWMKKHNRKWILFEPAKTGKEVSEMKTSTSENVGTRDVHDMFGAMWDKATKKKKKEGSDGGGKMMGEQEAVLTQSGDGYCYDGSKEAEISNVRTAVRESKKYSEWPDILATFEDRVYVSSYDNLTQKTRYFEVPYEEDEDGKITLGDATELKKEIHWILKEQAEKMLTGLFPIEERLVAETKETPKAE